MLVVTVILAMVHITVRSLYIVELCSLLGNLACMLTLLLSFVYWLAKVSFKWPGSDNFSLCSVLV